MKTNTAPPVKDDIDTNGEQVKKTFFQFIIFFIKNILKIKD